MATKAEIKEALHTFVKRRNNTAPIVCTVESVDTVSMTCYCIPKNGTADITDVRLMAKNTAGFLLVPKEGSDVVVAFIDAATAYVSMFSQVEEIMLNGDAFGGLIKLSEWITDINNRMTLFKTAINSAFIATDTGIGSAGGAGTSASTWSAAIAADADFIKSNYENTTVKHGNGT